MGEHKTVFSRRHKPWTHINDMAVTFTHRAAFILYCIYALWAAVAGSIALYQQNFVFTFWFAWSILPVSVLCGLGALYFPRWARMEMSAAVILVTLLVTYEVYQAYELFYDFDFGNLNNAILDASFAVVPLARALFVFYAFIVTGRQKGIQ
jgi:hypothetical protein